MNLLTKPEWTDFLTRVREAQHRIGDPEVIWFRGHGNENHYLLPTLLRYKNGLDRERYLFHKFRKFADRVFVERRSEWETLFDMQHYGIPTRLLDWTESLGIAIFFATYDNLARMTPNNAAIYVINPIGLNSVSGIGEIYRLPYDEMRYSYSKIYWDRSPMRANAPIAVEPVFINNRMVAQRGMFKVHNDLIDPIENLFPNYIQKVTLPNSAFASAGEFLKIANIDEFSVYPDLSGIAGYMKNTSSLESRW
jgi:hypothetical protein